MIQEHRVVVRSERFSIECKELDETARDREDQQERNRKGKIRPESLLLDRVE